MGSETTRMIVWIISEFVIAQAQADQTRHTKTFRNEGVPKLNFLTNLKWRQLQLCFGEFGSNGEWLFFSRYRIHIYMDKDFW